MTNLTKSLLHTSLHYRGVYYARDHLESGGGKKNKKFDGGGKKNTNFDGAGGKNEFQLSGAKLKF